MVIANNHINFSDGWNTWMTLEEALKNEAFIDHCRRDFITHQLLEQILNGEGHNVEVLEGYLILHAVEFDIVYRIGEQDHSLFCWRLGSPKFVKDRKVYSV